MICTEDAKIAFCKSFILKDPNLMFVNVVIVTTLEIILTYLSGTTLRDKYEINRLVSR